MENTEKGENLKLKKKISLISGLIFLTVYILFKTNGEYLASNLEYETILYIDIALSFIRILLSITVAIFAYKLANKNLIPMHRIIWVFIGLILPVMALILIGIVPKPKKNQ